MYGLLVVKKNENMDGISSHTQLELKEETATTVLSSNKPIKHELEENLRTINPSTPHQQVYNTEETYVEVLIQKKIDELNVPIIDSISKEQIDNFKFFNIRHYEDRYFLNCNKQGQYEDVCIRVHTNKLYLLSLASGNDIILSGKKIAEVNFVVNNADRSKIKVVGKRKLGARHLHPDTIVCRVRLEGEEEMRNIRAGISGYLVEINEFIKNDPNLLITDPKSYGYLAITMPKGHSNDFDVEAHTQLISEHDYLELLLRRNNGKLERTLPTAEKKEDT